MLKALNSEFLFTEIWFTNKPLEIQSKYDASYQLNYEIFNTAQRAKIYKTICFYRLQETLVTNMVKNLYTMQQTQELTLQKLLLKELCEKQLKQLVI